MAFFIDKTPFTHYARFYGIPCYYKSDGPDGCELAGTNAVYDWLILHACPWIHWLIEQIRGCYDPTNYEPGPWQIELRGEIEKPRTTETP